MAIFFLVIATSKSTNYACKVDFTASNQIPFAILGITLIFALTLLATNLRIPGKAAGFLLSKRGFVFVSILACLILLLWQINTARSSWFKTGWDVETIASPWSPDNANQTDALSEYLSYYPNQQFLFCVFQHLMKIAGFLGIQDGYLALIAGSCISISTSIAFASIASANIYNVKVGYISLILMLFLLGASPWFLVPYSDTYSMPFTSSVLLIYSFRRKNGRIPYLSWFAITFLSLIGYSIKPTAIFALAAIVAVEIASYPESTLRRKSLPAPKQAFIWCLKFAGTCIASLMLFLVSSSLIKNDLPAVDSTKSFSSAHFLMMGANTETNGVFCAEDVAYTSSIPSIEKRNEADISVWKSRIDEMGITGVSELAAKKTLTNYADGSFAWAQEGGFWRELKPDPNTAIYEYYGIGQLETSNDPLEMHNGGTFLSISQILWLGILFFLPLNSLSKRHPRQEAAVFLSLIALTLFLTIFEARARYLLLYVPYFIILGSAGAATVAERIMKKRRA